ncbi:MAG: DUF1622 domain-containing protein [Pyrinomonadaceae bacterium]
MDQKMSPESWTSVLLPLALILGLALLLSLNVGQQAGGEGMPSNALEPWLKFVASYLVAGVEIAAALVIGIAALRGIVAYLGQLIWHSNQPPDSTESIRLRLGRVLALGLEFTIASDILRTAVAPTRQDIMNLGAIVLLRTLLNYFLEREIRMGDERKSDSVATT